MKLKYLQEGGAMPMEGDPNAAPAPAPEGAPAAGGQEEMLAQLQQVAMDIVQQMGPEAAMALAQMIVEIVQGGGQPQEAAMPAPEEQPTYQRKGGRLFRIK